jgi:hypothetical protein
VVVPTAVASSPLLFAYKVGDCIKTSSSRLSTPGTVPCTQPNGGKIFAIIPLADGPYPGQDKILNLALSGCDSRYDAAKLPPERKDGAVSYMVPSESSWPLGDRKIGCLVPSDIKL